MTVFRHLATITGVLTTLLATCRVQATVKAQMKANGCSSGSIQTGRIISLFITALLVGGGCEALVRRVFSQGG